MNSRGSTSKTFFQLGMESIDFFTHLNITNSFLFPEGVLLSHCFCWGREHNYTIFMKKPLLFPSLVIEKTGLRDWSSTQAKATFVYADARVFGGDTNHGRDTNYGNKIFVRVFFILLMVSISLGRAYTQATHDANLTCIANTLTADAKTKATTTYAALTPHAIAGTQGTGVSITESWKLIADSNGDLGFFHGLQISATSGNQITCLNNTSNTRQYALYSYAGNTCTGSAIVPTILNDGVAAGGGETNPMNPAWAGLTPNGTYVIIVKTTVGASCSDLLNTYGGYYGKASTFTFNCGTATTTGVFIAGTNSSGTLVVPISGATAGNATFSVSGTNFTGTLTTTLTAGQTSVTVPITYDGTGTIGNRILTVTSSQGTGTCSKSIVVETDSDGDGITDTNDLDDDNDGILDTVECFYQPSAINSTWTGSGNNWNSGFSPTTINAAFSGVTSIAGQTMDRTGFSNPSVNTAPDIFFIYATGSAPGSITLTFNKPVTNPILHIAGIGGVSGGNLSSLITLGGGLAWSELSESSASYVSDATTVYKNVSDAVLDASGSLQISGTVSTISLAITTQTGSSNGNDGIRITLEVPTAYSICSDTDGDEIADKLDLDSDGDGCPDAIEGGANLATSNLVTSTMAGGNIGTGYTGTSTNSVVKNLGNTVGNTTTTLGVPTVAGTGQAVGNSENKLVQSANCVTCNAGTTAPILTATTKSNVCPAASADISALVSSTCPVGSTIEWHTVSTGFAAINKVADPSTVLAGTYYPVCHDATNICYSPAPATGVTVTITTCLSITQPTTQTGLQSVAKSGTVPTDITVIGGVGTITYSNGSADPACVAPSGATALPTASNLVINANDAYTYTTPAIVGTYYFCVKVCDSTTPIPNCKIAIYKVVVSPPPCNVGSTAPKIN